MVTILCWYLKFLVSQWLLFCFCEAQRIFSKHVCQRMYYLTFIKFNWHALNMGINIEEIGSDNPMLGHIKIINIAPQQRLSWPQVHTVAHYLKKRWIISTDFLVHTFPVEKKQLFLFKGNILASIKQKSHFLSTEDKAERSKDQ